MSSSSSSSSTRFTHDVLCSELRPGMFIAARANKRARRNVSASYFIISVVPQATNHHVVTIFACFGEDRNAGVSSSFEMRSFSTFPDERPHGIFCLDIDMLVDIEQ